MDLVYQPPKDQPPKEQIQQPKKIKLSVADRHILVLKCLSILHDCVSKFDASIALRARSTYCDIPEGDRKRAIMNAGVMFAEQYLDKNLEREMDKAWKIWLEYKNSES